MAILVRELDKVAINLVIHKNLITGQLKDFTLTHPTKLSNTD